MKLTFPDYIFSEKEIKDLIRREQVARMLRAGQSWKNIKETTGAHLQTIAIISKRLKSLNNDPEGKRTLNKQSINRKRPIFFFGQVDENK